MPHQTPDQLVARAEAQEAVDRATQKVLNLQRDLSQLSQEELDALTPTQRAQKQAAYEQAGRDRELAIAERDREANRVTKRMTLNLSARSYAALESIVTLTDGSKTEAVNKALQAFALILQKQYDGGGAWLQGHDDKPVRVIFQ